MAVSADLIKKAREQVKAQKGYNDDQYEVVKKAPVKSTPAKTYDTDNRKELLNEKKALHPTPKPIKTSVKDDLEIKGTYTAPEKSKPWYKQSGKDLIMMALDGIKKQRAMTPEERAENDAAYRTKLGGQPAAYLSSRAEEGLSSFNQGAWNAAATLAANSPLKFVPGAVEAIKEPQNKFEKQIQANTEENRPASKGQEILGDVVSSTTRMAPSIFASFINPALGTASFAVPAGGQYAREAELEGATDAQQLSYGIVGGTIEAAIEKVAFINPLKKHTKWDK